LKQIKGMADLTDVQWEQIRPLVEFGQKRRADNRGRPWRDARQVLNGALWVLRTGAPWHDLPARYGPYQTCHRRFQQWQRLGVLNGILWALAEDLLARGKLGLEETFIDASFMGAKKGAMALVERSSAKGASSWQLQTAMVFLSPCGLGALRRMSKSWSRRPSSIASWRRSRSD
jgi:transposase